MKIEINGKYKTRAGHSVQIYRVFEENHAGYVVHGSYLREDNSWLICTWTADGHYFLDNKNRNSLDLVPLTFDDFAINDAVVVWNDDAIDEQVVIGHFAGVNEDPTENKPTIWADGKTSYTAKGNRIAYDNCTKFKQSFL